MCFLGFLLFNNAYLKNLIQFQRVDVIKDHLLRSSGVFQKQFIFGGKLSAMPHWVISVSSARSKSAYCSAKSDGDSADDSQNKGRETGQSRLLSLASVLLSTVSAKIIE